MKAIDALDQTQMVNRPAMRSGDTVRVHVKVREGDKDRFLATLFAPPKYRRALYALYAFNRERASCRYRAREPLPGPVPTTNSTAFSGFQSAA